MSPERVELVLDAKARLGEGAVWDAGRQILYWVDIEGFQVHAFDPATGRDRSFALGDHVGTVVSRARGGVALTVSGRAVPADREGEAARSAALLSRGRCCLCSCRSN